MIDTVMKNMSEEQRVTMTELAAPEEGQIPADEIVRLTQKVCDSLGWDTRDFGQEQFLAVGRLFRRLAREKDINDSVLLEVFADLQNAGVSVVQLMTAVH